MTEKQTQRDRVILVKTGAQRARIGQLFSISSVQIITFAEIQDRFKKFLAFLFELRRDIKIPKRSWIRWTMVLHNGSSKVRVLTQNRVFWNIYFIQWTIQIESELLILLRLRFAYVSEQLFFCHIFESDFLLQLIWKFCDTIHNEHCWIPHA